MKHFVITAVMLLAFVQTVSAQDQAGDAATATTPAPGQEQSSDATTAPTPAAVEEPDEADDADDAEEAEEPAKAEKPAEEPRGIKMPGNIRLNGKFDISYERYGYNTKIKDGDNALRNYHHFVFLSHNEKDKPLFFTAELTERYFYEFGARIRPKESAMTYTFRTGKIIVPFGGEPTFHHTYGGLTGFDQPVLPVIWAQHGAAGQVKYKGNGWTISDDIYAVQGYDLPSSDAVLSLQGDFSNKDKVRVGLGNRLGFGMGPASIWYSAYYNSLDYSRRLFMQAIDAEVYRATDLPVIKDLALAVGVLRADVSGGKSEGTGGKGKDYYHYANYVELRYFPLENVTVVGRTGLRTFDNRNGTYIDEDRLDKSDGSSHNIGVIYKWGALSAQLAHYWNFEKKDEIKNDFLRLRMGYDF